MKKLPVWELLIECGYVNNRKSAESLVMAGKVLVDEQRIDFVGERVKFDSKLRVKGAEHKYVGKGGLKLEGALQDFRINVDGMIALDTGASTGGFTDCLIQHGASMVYAVDVGYGQLAGKLRNDVRVVNMERTNIGDVTPSQLNPQPNLAVIDWSYLSLKVGIPIVSKLLNADGQMLCLVKPLFEVDDSEIRRTGVIENPSLYSLVLRDLVAYIDSVGAFVRGVRHSHVTGNAGTREFFIWISLTEIHDRIDVNGEIEVAVRNALALPEYSRH